MFNILEEGNTLELSLAEIDDVLVGCRDFVFALEASICKISNR